MDFLKGKIIEELAQQGHRASGALEKSIEALVEEKGSILVGKILMSDYSIYLDKGVKPERVPFNPGSGAKSSKYIDALIEWSRWIKPGLSERERKSFAFAVAHTAKREGHPTSGSYAFSQNGRRKSWSEFSIDRNLDEFIEILDLESEFNAELENKISQFTKAA